MGEFMEDVLRFFGAVIITAIWMGLAMLITVAMHGGWVVFVMTLSLLPWAWVLIVLAMEWTKDQPK